MAARYPGPAAPRGFLSMAPAPRKRRLPGLLLALLIPVALVGGIYLGGHPRDLPGPVRDALVADEGGRLYEESVDIIARDYYRPVDRDKLLDASLTAAVRSLGDRFSGYLDPRAYRTFQDSSHGRFSGIGVSVAENPRGLRVMSVFAGSPARRAGIEVGDVLVAVNGRSLAGKPIRVSTGLIQGRPGTRLTLTYVSRGRRQTRRITRAQVDIPVVRSRLRTTPRGRVVHARLASFTSGSHGDLRDAIDRDLKRGGRGVVLDLRGNGGGLLNEAVLVASIFIPEGRIVSTRGRSRPERTFESVGTSIDRDVPVVVLVDRGSASAAEIVAGAIQDRRRGTVVGARTFGKGVFQEIEELPNGGALDITVGQYFLPSGRNLGGAGVRAGAGIRPDVAARDRRATRSDEALDVALRTLAARLR